MLKLKTKMRKIRYNKIMAESNESAVIYRINLKNLIKALKSPSYLKRFINYNKHIVLYFVFGVLTTVVNLISFYIFAEILQIETIPATIWAWVVAVAFAFITNRLYVFESTAKTHAAILREAILFFIARLVTLGIEVFIMWLSVDICGQNKLIWKVICNIIVIIVNYTLSKAVFFSSSRTSKRLGKRQDKKNNK